MKNYSKFYHSSVPKISCVFLKAKDDFFFFFGSITKDYLGKHSYLISLGFILNYGTS